MSYSTAFILVHYHCADLLEHAVAAILADRIDAACDLVVVDNGSNALEQARLRSLPARVLENRGNPGYAAGLNLGIAHTQAEYIVLMNSDVFVFPGCTERLLAALRTDAGACGPRFYWDDRKTLLMPPTEKRTVIAELASAAADRGDRLALFARRQWRKHAHRHWLAREPFLTACLSGALIATRRSVLGLVGPFDEGYRLYCEEQDWLARLQARSLRSVHVPGAEAVHLYNQSAPKEPQAQAWSEQATTRFAARHYPRWLPWAISRVRGSGSSRPTKLNRLERSPPRIDLASMNRQGDPAAWIEVSPLVRGFPASASRIDGTHGTSWSLPTSVWRAMAPGNYYLTVCARSGRELFRSAFARPAEP